MTHEFKITRTQNPKVKPDIDKLGFGIHFTDHMFVMKYTPDKGWHDGEVVPFGPLCLSPAASVFHYGQEMFEGMKAYRTADGRVLLFRPDMNVKRTNNTNERVCMPQIEESLMIDAIKTVVDVDRDWIPDRKGTSLYIRPFIIASEPFLGVRPSNDYLFVVILSPVGSYYANSDQTHTTKIFVEDVYTRAAVGGTGMAKIGANYVMGLKAQEKAHSFGYDQVLWLDGKEKKYVQEIGTSNAFFVIDGEIITAPLTDGTILPGITRDTILALLRDRGAQVNERNLEIEEVFRASDEGRLNEVFASGTAAVISPVGELRWKDRVIQINNDQIGPVADSLYKEIVAIQTGEAEDRFGWTVEV